MQSIPLVTFIHQTDSWRMDYWENVVSLQLNEFHRVHPDLEASVAYNHVHICSFYAYRLKRRDDRKRYAGRISTTFRISELGQYRKILKLLEKHIPEHRKEEERTKGTFPKDATNITISGLPQRSSYDRVRNL